MQDNGIVSLDIFKQALRDDTRTGGAYLSGAGPILVAFLPDPQSDASVADRALEALKRQGTPATAQLARYEPHGTRLEVL